MLAAGCPLTRRRGRAQDRTRATAAGWVEEGHHPQRAYETNSATAQRIDDTSEPPAQSDLARRERQAEIADRDDLARYGARREQEDGDAACGGEPADHGQDRAHGASGADVGPEAGFVRVPVMKTGVARIVPLPATVRAVLRHYIQRFRGESRSDRIFLRHAKLTGTPVSTHCVRMAMRRGYRRCGFPGTYGGTHVLRRTFATRVPVDPRGGFVRLFVARDKGDGTG